MLRKKEIGSIYNSFRLSHKLCNIHFQGKKSYKKIFTQVNNWFLINPVNMNGEICLFFNTFVLLLV